jgi:hypothetical protein
VLIGRLYRGADLAGQGHIAVLLPDGKVLQSTLKDGLNDYYTIEQSHAGGYYDVMVHPSKWINTEGGGGGARKGTTFPHRDYHSTTLNITSASNAHTITTTPLGTFRDLDEEEEMSVRQKKEPVYIEREASDVSDKVIWMGAASIFASTLLGLVETTWGLPAPEGADVYLAGFLVAVAGTVAGYLKRDRA